MAPPDPWVLVAATASFRTVLLGFVFVQVSFASGTTKDIMLAYNITWKSLDFKTILEWEPKPANFVYSVEISTRWGNWKRKCFQIKNTECDLTDEIKNLRDTYIARIISEKQETSNEDPEESLHANAPDFIPYFDTNLGRPKIADYSQNDTKLRVEVEDSITSFRLNGVFQTLRQIFHNDLTYTLFYWKASSTGKKSVKTNTNEFLVDVDKGESYCFSVQAEIQSRRAKQKSPESKIICTSKDKVIFTELFFTVGGIILGGIFIFIFFCICICCVFLCKCSKSRAKRNKKENKKEKKKESKKEKKKESKKEKKKENKKENLPHNVV